MFRFMNSRLRAACGCAAVTLAVFVMGVTIVIPATMRVEFDYSLHAPLPGSIEADIVPAHIDVYGVREPKLVTSQRQEAGGAQTKQTS